ncbi:MAG TPA: CDP-alcohol phosphatidyltransferase family protein [Gammaproteobacteria bacterium]|nr:CDP-alcohol phosphatidyltransferase family protein [Gammaproteobacteria bacterium]HIB25794.1 CDP-alcohol phosphatidyltransferase family protein [Gammaproteobacteria bacterium]HIG35075.1 CDP-alcohol phosphatidyltransferase family protein [Gammaproteobacteria bacterium]HIK96914.1 CDP-alcohol phosphatidyltransferase family protein [Gammaproteobacteria bacterium]
MSPSNIPNLICFARIALVIPIIRLLWQEQFLLSLLLILIAGLSDILDGYLAKKNNWRSYLGAVLDPAADKILLVSLFITLQSMDLIPLWLTLTVILRDLMIVFGLSLYRYFVGVPQPKPTRISKFNTLLQLAFIILVILAQGIQFPFAILSMVCGSLVFVTSILSGLDYWIIWSIKAKKKIYQSGR